MGKKTSKETTPDMFEQAETIGTAATVPMEVVAENGTSVITAPITDAKTYKSCIKKIDNALASVKKSFFNIAFSLEWIDNTNAYVLDGYENIESFAKEKFAIGKTSTYNYIHVARRFGTERDAVTGEIKGLRDAYKAYGPTQLIILYDANVTDKQIEDLGINATLTCTEIKNRIKGLDAIESKPQSDTTGDSDTGDSDTGDSDTDNGDTGNGSVSADSTNPSKDGGIMTGDRQYAKTNNLLTIASLDDFDRQKNSILDLIRKTLSQDGLQCSVTINMVWN